MRLFTGFILLLVGLTATNPAFTDACGSIKHGSNTALDCPQPIRQIGIKARQQHLLNRHGGNLQALAALMHLLDHRQVAPDHCRCETAGHQLSPHLPMEQPLKPHS